MTAANLRIDEDRLWATLMRSAEIGPGSAGGLKRLSLTEEDRAVREQLADWAKADGLPLTVDQGGNMFIRYEGREDLPPVVMGSHLDTQVAGGRFDGILGVLGGLEVVRTLKDAGVTPRRPLEVVNWTNEEGARFSPPMMSSAVFAGLQDLDWLYGRTDDDGVTYRDALDAIGFRGDTPIAGRELDSYFELHIEQGPMLIESDISVGVVTAGYTVHGMAVRMHGETAHTGPTPMARRRNALVGAALVAVATDAIGHAYAPIGKATAARLVAWPNKPGILSNWAEITVDVRHEDAATADQMLEELKQAVDESAKRANVEAEIASTWYFGDEVFDPDCISRVRQAAVDLEVSHTDIKSQAGHDAYYISRAAPTAMIFSPCVDGITHNESEDVPVGPTMDAVNVLLHAALGRADRA